MQIGLLFGSFNPIHTGHLIIASYIADHTDLDRIWFVVSPQNPLKNSASLLNEQHRLSLVQTAIDGDDRFKASNIEFKMPKPSYTIDTLARLSETYPEHQFSVIIGSDSWMNISNWKNYLNIINNYNIYIYIRPGFEPDPNVPPNIQFLHAPLLDISATTIRKNIKEGKSIRYLVTDEVMEEIKANNYYGSELENPSQKNT